MASAKVGVRLRASNNGSILPQFIVDETNGIHREAMIGRPRYGRRREQTRERPLLQAIRDAALDPEVDAAKFDRLLTAQDKLDVKDAQIAFDRAFVAMQSELPVLVDRGVVPAGAFSEGYRYALWEDTNEAIKPVLARFGFGIRFRISQDQRSVTVTAILSHTDGHAEETTLCLPVDLTGGKNPVQAIGSSTSYGKRYTASALLNLTSRGEDDDGKSAAPGPRISAEQLSELRKLIEWVRGDERRLAAYLGVPALEELPPALFERAKAALEAKGGRL